MKAIPMHKFKRMMSLLTKAGLQGRRHAICWEVSNHRTESSKELTGSEMDAVIAKLEAGFKEEDINDVMRKKIISQARQMHWEVMVGGELKCDMERLNNWCLKYGMFHKDLNKHNHSELTQLLTQFQNAYKHYLNSI